jgi:hypothetical protein
MDSDEYAQPTHDDADYQIPLPVRTPQSGMSVPRVEPLRDLALMQRVKEGLERLE